MENTTIGKDYALQYLNTEVTVEIDRPIHSRHPKHNFIYEVNYGYVPDSKAPDGEEVDAYVLGVNEPIKEYVGVCIAIIHRLNDEDDKLVIVPQSLADISDEEIRKATDFQEKFFQSEIIRKTTE